MTKCRSQVKGRVFCFIFTRMWINMSFLNQVLDLTKITISWLVVEQMNLCREIEKH